MRQDIEISRRRRTSGSRPGPEKYLEDLQEICRLGRRDLENIREETSQEEEVQQAPTSIKLVNALKEVHVTGDKTECTRRTVRLKTTPRGNPTTTGTASLGYLGRIDI